MNLIVSKEQLLTGLQTVQNAIQDTVTPIGSSILFNVLLRAKKNFLELTSTDLNMSITCAVEAKVFKGGAITLPAKKLLNITRKLAASEIELKIDGIIASLNAGPSFFKIYGTEAKYFPSFPTMFGEDTQIELAQEKVKDILRKTKFAASADSARYTLNSTLLHLENHTLTMVSTDGRRLAMVNEEIEPSKKNLGEFIIHKKTINALSLLLRNSGKVTIHCGKARVSFTLRDENTLPILLVADLIQCKYPNYRQVIPTQTRNRVTLNRKELRQALCRAEVINDGVVKLSLTRDNLAITANSPAGEANESLTVDYAGEDTAIALNPSYLLEPLNDVLDDDEIYLELIDKFSPIILKTDDASFLYVAMPVHLSHDA